jgi:oligopeptide/dipeptide ABC transporter ATP-binding protein
MDNIPLIETRNLKKYYRVNAGMLHAVDGIDLKIPEGRTLGVVGESGCGKTTLGRTILKLIEPTSGDILYNGESIIGYGKDQMREMRKAMQIIFQDPYASIDPRMTVVESIAEFMMVHKMYGSRRETYNQAAKLMDTVGLARRLANAYPHELDGGRRQRIGIARALSLGPRFIVCDEPVSALDVSIQAQILNLLMDLQEEKGLTYMFITHDLRVVKHIANAIMVVYLGQCIETGPVDTIFEKPGHPYTKILLSSITVADYEQRNNRPEIIRGEVKSPIDPKSGCRFADRCKYAEQKCTEEEQTLCDLEADHKVACWKAGLL